MEDSRTRKLHQLLKKLGQAVHGNVVNSDEVQACLRDLHAGGWDALMLLQASLVCRDSGQVQLEDSSMHLHVAPAAPRVEYTINKADAAFLASLGISPTRHRSAPSSPAVERHDQSDR
jgi:hypothetical protein